MTVDYDTLYEFVQKLGSVLSFDCMLVAAGGTALTFHNIKHSTKDVDFVMECGDEKTIRDAINSIHGPQTDLFSAGTVFNNPLPADYISRAKNIGVFGSLKVLAMNPLDVIMTKIARAEEKDIEDIRSCAENGYTVDNILGMMEDYHINTPELRNNMRNVLLKVYNIDTDSWEDDMR